MKAITAALLFAVAMSASGQPVMKVDPIITNPYRSVDVNFGNSWGSGCPPRSPSVSVSGSSINIAFSVPSTLCTDNIVPWQMTVHLGTFPPGVYDIVATVPQINVTLGRAQLIVRDMDYVHFQPSVVIGARPVSIWTDDFASVQSVTIGGVTTPVNSDGTFVPPQHAPGTVDVTVNLMNAAPVVMKSALTYDDPAAPPDPRFFEPVFFPIAYRGGGAFGSSWVTTNRVGSHGGPVSFRTSLPCGGCGPTADVNGVVLDANNDPSGVLLYALRETASTLYAQSRIRELTRFTIGTSVPVAREHDFAPNTLLINDVPVASNARTMLRLRILGDVPAGAVLFIATPEKFETVPLTGNSAAIDISPLMLTHASFVNLVVQAQGPGLHLPLWGFVTVTDNASQQVTIVAP